MANPLHATARPPAEPAATPDAAFLDAMQAQIATVLWSTDTELRCRFASRAAATRLGLRVGASLAGDGALAGHPALLAAHRRALAGETVRHDFVAPDALVTLHIEPLRDATGEIIGVLGSGEQAREGEETARAMFEQRQIFLTTLEQAPSGIAIWDARGDVIYLNAMARIYTEQEAVGAPGAEGERVWGVWHDEHGPIALEDWPVNRLLRGETVAAKEMYKYKRDGTRQCIYFSVTPIYDATGTLIAVVGTAADITELKRIEAELRAANEDLEERVRMRTAALEQATRELEHEVAERQRALEMLARSERLLSDIVNHSPTPIFLKDLESRYLLINRTYEELFHVTNQQIFGVGDEMLFPPAVVAQLRASDQLVLAAGRAMQFEESVPVDGRYRTYVSVKFPLHDEHGKVYGVCGIATDITEMKAIQAELQNSRATLAAVIESSPDPIWAVDRRYRLIAFNEPTARYIEAVIGEVPMPGTRYDTQVPPEYREAWAGRVMQAMAGERISFTDSVTIDGATRHFLVSLNPTRQGDAVTGVAVFSKDVTDLVRAEEQVRQHQAELAHALRLHTMGEMAASVAHEVNQPLGAIANYAQGCRHRMLTGSISTTDLLAVVEAISAEALRAGEIIRRVRELLRKEQPRHELTDANAIVRTAVRLTESAARRAEVTLHLRTDERPLHILGDAIQLEQVIVNLVLNAIEALAGWHGVRRIEVTTRLSGDGRVEVAVRDSGPGIDPSLGDSIFDPFLTTKRDGLGMGLAISRTIVAAHEGTLRAAPNPGGGAVFRVSLPAAAPAAPAAEGRS